MSGDNYLKKCECTHFYSEVFAEQATSFNISKTLFVFISFLSRTASDVFAWSCFEPDVFNSTDMQIFFGKVLEAFYANTFSFRHAHDATTIKRY